jgi:hypothetical protein
MPSVMAIVSKKVFDSELAAIGQLDHRGARPELSQSATA